MLNECIPFYDDGDHITGYCTAAVKGCRFVKVSADRTGGKALVASDALADDRGAVHIATADAGGRIHGVAAYDGAQYAFIDVIRGSKMVVPVIAGAAISAFDEVAVGINGTAVPAGSETAVAATLVVDPSGANNAVLFTAKVTGTEGNDITVAYVAAATGHPAGSVVVDGHDITVYVTANTTTATEVIAAVTGDAAASALVTAANNSTDTGAGTVPAVNRASLAGGAEGGRADQAVGYVLADCATDGEAQVSLY